MKNEKIVTELKDLLDSFPREQQKRQEVLKDFLMKFEAEEQKLRKRLEKENNDEKCSKLNKKLDLVRAGYKLVKSNLVTDQA